MEISKDTRVSHIIDQYGNIADVMEVFGVKRVGKFSVRRVLTKLITVEKAAKIHKVPLDDFLERLSKAIKLKEQGVEAISHRSYTLNYKKKNNRTVDKKLGFSYYPDC